MSIKPNKTIATGKYRNNFVHKLNGGSGSGTTSISFNWLAPSVDSGNVTIFYSWIAADADGTESNDYAYTGSIVINKPVASVPLVLNCAANSTVGSCQTQAQVNTAFTNWLATATISGGCSASLSNNNTGAPPACGGSTTVTWTATSTCGASTSCSATFTVSSAPAVELTCATDQTENANQTQAAIDAAFNTWLASATVSGGCGTVLTNNNTGAQIGRAHV